MINAENEPTAPGEQAMIDATIDANDRVRERRFAKGLPCLLTGLTKEQWEAKARRPRVFWTEEEDAAIAAHFMQANGAFISYRKQAECLNEMFHGGKPVRTGSSVRRREISILKSSKP